MDKLIEELYNRLLSDDAVEAYLTEYAQRECKRPAPTGDEDEAWWEAKTQAMDLLLVGMVKINRPMN